MPLTPLHLGPAALIGLPLRRRLHLPTLILASVLPDLEPLVVVVFGLRYPVHGIFHTFLAALLAGSGLGLLMWVLERWLRGLFLTLFLEEGGGAPGLRGFVTAGVAGWGSHVLLDSPLYTDIRPLYPFTDNPLYAPWLYRWVNMFCLASLAAGILMYVYVAVRSPPQVSGLKDSAF